MQSPPIAAALALFAVTAAAALTRGADCRLAQTWYAGDVHFNERIELRDDATGRWVSSGMDGDARHATLHFTWTTEGDELVVRSSGATTKRVQYACRPYRDWCYLTFDDSPFVDDHSGFTLFSTVE